jgi:hypothetical protein
MLSEVPDMKAMRSVLLYELIFLSWRYADGKDK